MNGSFRKRVAAIVTEYRHNSHAEVIVGRLLGGLGYRPRVEVVSLYTDQVPANDMSRDEAARRGIPICATIRDAIRADHCSEPIDGVVIIGEHGDSELPLWSLANVAGAEVKLNDAEREEVFVNTRDAAYQIISAKGATYYAIALALDRICTAILRDEGAVLNVSTLLNDYHGVSDVYLGVPCVVDRSGVREVMDIPITAEEKELLHRSADKLKGLIESIQ